ncbi:MAG: hypothetical protein R6W99_06150, partial [Clostridia bacterium]
MAMKMELCEKLGLQWRLQPVLIEAKLPDDADTGSLSVYLDDECVPSDLFRRNGRAYASFAMSLEPYSKKTISTGPRGYQEEYITYEHDAGALTVRWLDRSIRMPAAGLYPQGRAPAFIESLTLGGREFLCGGGFISDSGKDISVGTELVFQGCQFCIARICYSKGDRLLASVDIEINGLFPQINIRERMVSSDKVSHSLRFFPTFGRARARLHTPRLKNHSKDFWERVEFSPEEQEGETLKLQPFYAWDINAGTYLAAGSDDGIVNIVPVNSSLWRNGKCMRLMASFIDGRLVLDAPDAEGAREWLLSVVNEDEDLKEIEPVKFTGNYNNYHYQTGRELKSNYHAERLSACCSAQSIGKLFTDIKPDYDVRTSPGVLVNRLDMPNLREKFKSDEFIGNTLAAQKKSPLGVDLAGSFMIDDDRATAGTLVQWIGEWLASRIGFFFNMGYPSVHLECIALSRPLRDVAIDLDIISGAIGQSDKERLFAALAYLACITGDRDYWPAPESGFDRGNMNFHSDMYSCLGVCACVLNGHPMAGEWARYAADELGKELCRSVYPGGAWAEAPTYHLASLSHLLVLAAALKNCGFENFFLHPRLVETMEFLAHIQTPTDPRCGFSMIPSLGDTTSNILTQSWQALFAWVAKNTFREMPEFSARMMRAWIDGGRMRLPFSYNSGLKLAIAFVDPELPAAIGRNNAGGSFDGFGVVMKNDGGKDRSGYLVMKAGEINNHYDHDEGTFIWYCRGVPLLVDYGTQYNPCVDQSFWHNRISIDHKSDWCRGRVCEFTPGVDFDYARMQVIIDRVQEWPEYPDRDPGFNFRNLPDPYEIPEHLWTREIFYLKKMDSLLVIDRVDGSLPYDWNLHVLADNVVTTGNRATFG